MLRLAADDGSGRMPRRLVASGADINERIRKDGTTLLHHAAATGNGGFVALLIERGANPNVTRGPGTTPLHLAIQGGFEFIAEQLAQAGADCNAVGAGGRTPVHLAAMQGMERLINQMVWKHRGSIHCRDRRGNTPCDLASASRHEHLEQVLKGDGPRSYEEVRSSRSWISRNAAEMDAERFSRH